MSEQFQQMIDDDSWNVLMFYLEGPGAFLEALNFRYPSPSASTVPPFLHDRTRCHVLLCTEKHGKIQLDAPFTSNFGDPVAYAKHMLDVGYMGFLIKDNHENSNVIVQTCQNILNKYALAGILDKPN